MLAPCSEECPVLRAALILEGKWTLVIIRELLHGKRRYSQLQRSLTGISPRLLALRLRELESKSLLTRHVYPTNPPTTDYELTPLGLQLKPVISSLATFGQALPQ